MTCDICGGEHENRDCPYLPSRLIQLAAAYKVLRCDTGTTEHLLAAAEEIRRLRKGKELYEKEHKP